MPWCKNRELPAFLIVAVPQDVHSSRDSRISAASQTGSQSFVKKFTVIWYVVSFRQNHTDRPIGMRRDVNMKNFR